MAKLTLQLQSRVPKADAYSHDGSQPNRYTDDDEMISDMPASKTRSLLRNQKDVQDQGALQFPNDYIDKMFVSKANWLGLLERTSGRTE